MTGEAKNPSQEAGPLSGITVIDASRVLAGPFCTMQLGDLGADVIKIERPSAGDQTRGWTPPTYPDSNVSSYYASINRNKRSMTLNLNAKRGQDVFLDLVEDADIIVENFRIGTMEDWDIGYTQIKQINSDIIYCKISGYGEWGPDKDRPAYDLIMQGEAGFMSFTGEENGKPVRVGVAIIDLATGLYATQAILAGLLERELGSNKGQKIDVSLFDTATALTTYMATSYFATGTSPDRRGSKHPNIAPYQAFPTTDGYVVVAVASENLWPKFCQALDRQDLIDDERFATNSDRVTNRDQLDSILTEVFQSYNTQEILDKLDDYGVPATPINDMEAVFSHEQTLARGMRTTVDHPTAGSITFPGSPLHFSRTPTTISRYPPLLGEHTQEILKEFGYSQSEITTLKNQDII
ncbi:MAG: CaiB/BaiF CoA transferase family protein [Halobacteriaceae archaeon]